ncbi:MAG TPA: aldehyde dehydrogenase family protein [Steroidobacteraceae bacterium]|nr:aldehyde dehydrogenase family protein [Steroidobacteraceae bacterium]
MSGTPISGTPRSEVAAIFDTMSYGPAPEAEIAARAWLAAHGARFGLYINGTWVAPLGDDAAIDCRNPATGEHLAAIGSAGPADVDAAVAAASAAAPRWAGLRGFERARVLYALARLVQKSSRILAVLESLDNGKPIRESRDIDIPLVARHFYHHAGWAQLLAQEAPDRVPLGVVGQVIPWNFPLLMLAWKVAPALACGNTVVLKPAEFTSLTALYFAELCTEAGVPPGVVNIVTGAGETGQALVDHPGVAKIAFTGSTEVGRIIRSRTAGSGKKLSLELGGKSPFIVMDDADLDGAVEGLVDAIWFNQGEVCCAGSRLLVEESVASGLLAKIKSRLSKFRLGNPLDKCIDMGAIVDPIQLERIDRLVCRAESEGAHVWRAPVTHPGIGCYYPPTLLTGLGTANTAWREEIFGPVLAVMSFRSVSEAVQLANNTRYGLSATIWSENINRALALANAVKAGVVWVNCTNQFDAACPFGGYKESGFGREGGLLGLDEYLKPKNEWLGAGTVRIGAPQIAVGAPGGGDLIDRTAKNYIGGKQTRPDGGDTRLVATHLGRPAGRVGAGNRKDIRDAVEAAAGAESWAKTTAHLRAQILFYVAENLSVRAQEFRRRLVDLTGVTGGAARREVSASIERLFSYAAWADKFEGAVHRPPARQLALSVHEPLGLIGVVCPDTLPLLSFISLIAPVIAVGNRCVAVPSERYPLLATDFYQVLDTSDLPGGVLNIVTGESDSLAKTLAEHDQVDGLWYHGTAQGSALVEKASIGNLKRTWVNDGRARNWWSPTTGEGRVFLAAASQVKTIWLPYGD